MTVNQTKNGGDIKPDCKKAERKERERKMCAFEIQIQWLRHEKFGNFGVDNSEILTKQRRRHLH